MHMRKLALLVLTTVLAGAVNAVPSETKVFNYWDEDVAFPVSVSGGKNAALAMCRKGEAVVVMIDCAGGGDYAIRPDTTALGLSASFDACDLEADDRLTVVNGTVQVKLSKYDYVMVRLYGRGDK